MELIINLNNINDKTAFDLVVKMNKWEIEEILKINSYVEIY